MIALEEERSLSFTHFVVDGRFQNKAEGSNSIK